MRLAVQIPRDRASELPSTLAGDVDQILEIVASGEAQSTHKILGRALEISIFPGALEAGQVVLRPAEVGVGRNARRAFEALQAVLGLGLRVCVKGAAAEEFVGRNALLRTEFLAGELFGFVCGTLCQ